MIANLIYLLKKMRDKYDAHATLLKLADNFEETSSLSLIQGRGWLIQNKNLSIYIYRSSNCNHLLNCYRVMIKALGNIDINAQLL